MHEWRKLFDCIFCRPGYFCLSINFLYLLIPLFAFQDVYTSQTFFQIVKKKISFLQKEGCLSLTVCYFK